MTGQTKTSTHRAFAVAAVFAIATTAFAGGASAASAASQTGAAGTAATHCRTEVLGEPTRAREVARTDREAFAEAARRNHRSESALGAMANDDANHLWLDQCGRAYYTEPITEAATEHGHAAGAASTAAAAPAPLNQTFLLESKPGAALTIYLDFDGANVTGTAWNTEFGSSIVAAPYSISAPADTNFSTAELSEIQAAWQVVAEDYTPFDVNVTTKYPGAAALDRSSPSDNNYGTTVLVTANGPVYDSCRCGGLAYIDVFSESQNSAFYHPAWVFTSGTFTIGKNVGEAASHEAGHNLGLSHDGVDNYGYYSGTDPWAPIMGAGYYQPVTQWSRGEYPGATNTEDDVAIIAGHIPLRGDDYADSAAAAAALRPGAPASGIISTRTDADAFFFTAAGATSLTVTPTSTATNLDVSLRILSASGTTVATINPESQWQDYTLASGLDATWSATLPQTNADYVAVVDGGGSSVYTDYGSLGGYRISLTTQASPEVGPLTSQSSPALPVAQVGKPYSVVPVTASGGTRPYAYSATGLPEGLTLYPNTGAIAGTPTGPGTSQVVVTVTDAVGATSTRAIDLVVDYAPVALLARSLTGAKAGSPFSVQFSATGGDGTYVWAGTGVPQGLSLSPAGVLSGTPAQPGTSSITISVTSAGRTTSGTYTLTVAYPALSISTSSTLPGGRKGRAYKRVILATGGKPSLSWKKVSGKVPNGLHLEVPAGGNVTSVTLTGKPTVKGKFSFRLRVTDAQGKTAFRTFTITIRRA